MLCAPRYEVLSVYHSFHVCHILARDGTERRHEILPVWEWVELGEGPLGVGHAKVDTLVSQDECYRDLSCKREQMTLGPFRDGKWWKVELLPGSQAGW